MSSRYVVAEGQEFYYPADATSYRLLIDAGGVSGLSEEAKKLVKFKKVVAGDDCSDMPATPLSLYVERGWVLKVDSKVPTPEPISDPSIEEEGA